MNKRLTLLCMTLCFVFASFAQHLTVGTYNIRMSENDHDIKQADDWQRRYQHLCDLINFIQPDIFGAQEAFHNQITDMLSQLPEYAFIGVGREDGKQQGEYAPIFYNKNKIKLLKQGHFWLSPDPDKPELGWDAVCVRICTWGYFEELASHRRFYYFNTHMDHIGVAARKNGAKLIINKMKALMSKRHPVFLTGDFNVDQNSEAYREFANSGFLKDCYVAAQYRFAKNGTFNNFKPTAYTTSRIDHIFVSNSIDVQRYAILTDGYWQDNNHTQKQQGHDAPTEIALENWAQHVLSDHYPVFAKVKLP